MTTGESSGFLAAGGILPWREGDELPEDIIRRNRGDCSKIEAERDAALAEVERLHTANRLLLEERAAVRKALGEHFIAIADEDGTPTDSAYYMDQGVAMLADQWRLSQDQLERAHQELGKALAEVDQLRTLLAPIYVPCERCGRKVRGNIERVCQVCADENWSLNRD